MRVIDQLEQVDLENGCILTIGAFDGIHVGHQALVRAIVERARAGGRQSGVVTFYPHPVNVLSPANAIRYLTTPGEKAALLEHFGVDFMLLIQFTKEVAAQPADRFIGMLVEHLHPAEIWIGQDFALGKDRSGDVRTLRALGEKWGFTVHVMEPITWGGSVVSSSRIRQLLAQGNLEQATALLGRYYSLAGEVVRGHRRGHQLGFPTANLEVRDERALPKDGVLACFARLGNERFPAVANLGVRPTFDDPQHLLEVYLLDVNLDLYGCDLVVEFVKWLRPEMKFSSVDALIEQMKADVAQSRRILRAASPAEYHLAVSEPEAT